MTQFLWMLFAIAVPSAMPFALRYGNAAVAGSRRIIFATAVAIAITGGFALLTTAGSGRFCHMIPSLDELMARPQLFQTIIVAVGSLRLMANTVALYIVDSSWPESMRSRQDTMKIRDGLRIELITTSSAEPSRIV